MKIKSIWTRLWVSMCIAALVVVIVLAVSQIFILVVTYLPRWLSASVLLCATVTLIVFVILTEVANNEPH